MAKGQLRPVLRYLRRAVGQAELAGETDNLLEQFVLRQDQSAFASLVEHFGPMVFGVCRRVLGDAHDAEDAFQATFLVLARKADSIRQPGALGGWLYRVACHLALEARGKSAKRRLLERQSATSDAVDAPVQSEAHPWLDEELQRLPDKYLAPIRLHYLEGKTTEEAARELGCPKGTLLSRLDRGRDLLRERLTRRGVGLTSTALTMLLAEESALAAPLEWIEAATLAALSGSGLTPAVNALVEGALNSMFYSKVRMATAILLLLALMAGGAGILFHDAPAADDPKVAAPGKPEPLKVAERAGFDGVATSASLSRNGRYLAIEVIDPDKQRRVNGWPVNDASYRVIDLASLKEIHASPALSRMTGLMMAGMAMGPQVGPDGGLLIVPNLQLLKLPAGGIGAPGIGGLGGIGGGGGFGGIDMGQPEFIVLDMARKKTRFKLPASTTGAHFTADGSTIVSTQQTGDLLLWDAASGQTKGTIKTGGKTGGIPLVNVSPDGKRAALLHYDLGGRQPSVQVWDLVSKKALASKPLAQAVWSPMSHSFSPDGQAIAMVQGGSIKVWDTASGKDLFDLKVAGEEKMVDAVLYSPDGTSLAARCRGVSKVAGFGGGAGAGDMELVVFDLASRKERFRLPGSIGAPLQGQGSGLAFSPDGQLLAVVQEAGRGPEFGPTMVSHRVRIVATATGKTIHDLADQVAIIGFSPQDSYRTLLLTNSDWKEQPRQQGFQSLPAKIKVWEFRGGRISPND